MRGKERLDLRVSLDSPSLYARGMVDANGQLQRDAHTSRDEAPGRVTTIRAQLARLAR